MPKSGPDPHGGAGFFPFCDGPWLAAKPLPAVLATKRLLASGRRPAILARIEEEAAVFARMLREPAAQEAFAAFLRR